MPDSTPIPEILPLFPLREMVAFPYMILSLFLKDEETAPFEEAVSSYNSLIALVKLRQDGNGDGLLSSLHSVGTACRVTRLRHLDDGGAKVTLEGLARVQLQELTQEKPLTLARLEVLREFVEKGLVSEALVSSLSALLKIALSYGRPLPDDVMKMIDYIDNPARLADLVTL